MKVVYTDEALRDLDEILTYIAANYPTAYAPFAVTRASSMRRCMSASADPLAVGPRRQVAE